MNIESAFDPLFSTNPRSQKYTKTGYLQNIDKLQGLAQDQNEDRDHQKAHSDFMPRIPDIILEDFIYDQNRMEFIRKNQALYKLIQDLPHLSVLEKNASYFVSVWIHFDGFSRLYTILIIIFLSIYL